MGSVEEVGKYVATSDGPPLGSTVVVATDGTHDSDEAVRVGVELGRQRGVDVQLISIVEPSDFTEYDGSTPADIARATSVAIASREGELTAQRQRVHVTTQEPAHQSICVGSRVEEIVKFAEQHHASLIVMGASSHGALARLLHRHTVMRVAAATEVPILAVRAD